MPFHPFSCKWMRTKEGFYEVPFTSNMSYGFSINLLHMPNPLNISFAHVSSSEVFCYSSFSECVCLLVRICKSYAYEWKLNRSLEQKRANINYVSFVRSFDSSSLTQYTTPDNNKKPTEREKEAIKTTENWIDFYGHNILLVLNFSSFVFFCWSSSTWTIFFWSFNRNTPERIGLSSCWFVGKISLVFPLNCFLITVI